MGEQQSAFTEAFASALARRGVTLASLHAALGARGTPVSMATLSYWRSGSREPEHQNSLRALAQIEDILGLPPGHLESLLPIRRRRPQPTVPWNRDQHLQESIVGLIHELDFRTPYDEVIDREVSLQCDVDETGVARRTIVTSVVEAVVRNAERVMTIVQETDPDAEITTIRPLGGHTLGRTAYDPDTNLVAVEFLLDRPLTLGETTVLQREYVSPGHREDADLGYSAVRRMTTVTLWARFHPDRLPVRCETYTVVGDDEVSKEVPLFGTSVSRTETQFGPGMVGVRWFWE